MSFDYLFHDNECISANFCIIVRIFPDLLLNNKATLWHARLAPGQCDQLSVIGHIGLGLTYNSGQIKVVFYMCLMLKLKLRYIHAHCHRGTFMVSAWT